MTIYLITIFLLFVLAFIEACYKLSPRFKNILLLLAFSVLVLQVGLRWETGTDWDQYLSHFKAKNVFTSSTPLVHLFEYGYNLFVWIVKLFTSKYSVFLFVHACIYYYLIFNSLNRYTPYFFTALILLYALSMGMVGSNRQLIALAICLYALRFAKEKKPIYFFSLVFLALNFHVTAILFCVYYFINREIKPIFLILLIVSSIIIGHFKLPVIIFSYVGNLIGGNTATKTILYLQGAEGYMSEYKLSIFGFIKRLAFLSIFYLNRNRISERLPYYKLLLNGYIIGIIFYFLFSSSLVVIVSRGSIYFNIMEPLLIASQLCLFKKKQNIVLISVLVLFLSVIFFFQSISSYPDLFVPYKGIFINSDFHRHIY